MAADPEFYLPIMKNEDITSAPLDINADVDQKQNIAVLPGLNGQLTQKGTKRTRRERGSAGGERSNKIPACGATPGKRSSIYRGVTRHRWTGRYEAHLWDKSTWNATQKKKGKQVYLGAYDEEEAAARAYDLAALKYWGPTTLINFPVTDYTKDIEEMQNVSREEYLASLRRKSSGFSRGVSKYRGVARHHHNGRWEARIGRVFGNKYLYLGTYSTQEEAAAAYDMAAIEYRGLSAVTNFDLSRYIRWLRPQQPNNMVGQTSENEASAASTKHTASETQFQIFEKHSPLDEHESRAWSVDRNEALYQLHNSMGYSPGISASKKSPSPTALSLLLQSTMFKQMLEKVSGGQEVVESEYDSGMDLVCDDFLSGQQVGDELQTELEQEKSSCYRGGENDNMYQALDPSEFTYSGAANTYLPSSIQFEPLSTQESALDQGLSLWSAFGASLANVYLESC